MRNRRKLALGIGLLALVAGVYWGIGTHAFLDYDDGEYVYDNPMVTAGLTPAGFLWAFTSGHAANWHPVTWLSHMLDVSLFGLDAGWHHRVNLLLHMIDTLLLFWLLCAMTRAPGRSAFAAALFGIHPLHVESVAWIAERKDLLAAGFALGALLAYVSWTRRPTRRAFAAAIVLFLLALLSKPTAVTLPFVMLLLDFWPLGRFGEAAGTFSARLARLVFEKIPFFLLAASASVVTFLVQSRAKATAAAAAFPAAQRLGNALVSYAIYLEKTFWPTRLAVFYPHPATLGQRIAAPEAIAALAGLLLLTALFLRQRRERPYLAVGWLWFLGTLVPMIGIVQAGSQARADRYTYIPLIGIFVIVSWGGFDLLARLGAGRRALAACAAAVLIPLGVAARVQAGSWRDATSLYTHAIAVTSENWLAWNNLGMQHLGNSEPARAEECFRRAVSIQPGYADAWYNLGIALAGQARHPEAIACYRRSLELDPGNADGWVNLAVEYRTLGNHTEAIRADEAALALRPSDPLALAGLVVSWTARGDLARAGLLRERLRQVDPAAARALEGN